MGSLSPSSPEGVTCIWIPVFFTLLLLTAIHFILSLLLIDTTIPNYSNADLKAKNYLNSSEPVIPNPFDFCPSYSPGDKIGAKYGAVTLSKSRMHLRSGARIQRVSSKALARQSVTISVLGGSGIPFFPPLSTHPKLNIRATPQCQHATVQGTTLYAPHDTHPASSSGVIPSFPTQLRN